MLAEVEDAQLESNIETREVALNFFRSLSDPPEGTARGLV